MRRMRRVLCWLAALTVMLIPAGMAAGALESGNEAALVAALMQKRGWHESPYREVIADSLTRVAANVNALSPTEILDLFDTQIASIQAMESDSDAVGLYHTFTKDIQVDSRYFTEDTLCHELLHALSGMRVESGYSIANFMYIDLDAQEIYRLCYEGMTEFFNFRLLFEPTQRSQRFSLGNAAVTTQYLSVGLDSYIYEMGLIGPLIYAVGFEEMEAAYFKSGLYFRDFEKRFNRRYGEDKLRGLIAQAEVIAAATYRRSRLSSRMKRLLYEEYADYSEQLLGILETRAKEVVTEGERIGILKDMEGFETFMFRFSDEAFNAELSARLSAVKRSVSAPPQAERAAQIQLVAAAADSISVAWPKVAGASGYAVLVSVDQKNWEHRLSTDQTAAVIKGLAQGTPYSVRVDAVAGAGGARILSLPAVRMGTLLSAPRNLRCILEDDVYIFSWDAVPGARGYRLLRADAPGGAGQVFSEGQETEYECMNNAIVRSMKYYYYVQAIDEFGQLGQRSSALELGAGAALRRAG